MLRRAGSLAPISVLEPNHIVELSCRHLEQEAIGHSHHTVKGSGWNMKHRFRPDLVMFEPFNIGPCDQLERAFEETARPSVVVVRVDYTENMKLTQRLGELISH